VVTSTSHCDTSTFLDRGYRGDGFRGRCPRTHAENDARILLDDLVAGRGRRLADQHPGRTKAQRSSRTDSIVNRKRRRYWAGLVVGPLSRWSIIMTRAFGPNPRSNRFESDYLTMSPLGGTWRCASLHSFNVGPLTRRQVITVHSITVGRSNGGSQQSYYFRSSSTNMRWP